ncbi:Hypothetical predicted protein [Olea europaea subsp. europaea]|uniref:Uncharacterized protein n=1 Tax=Olea europaea subsp. europaea TaxID=158383 RepID=A0A8S0PSM7_OLEEU|nr:Hypothetical predicted protein [Olea europaea subsp. europaea]
MSVEDKNEEDGVAKAVQVADESEDDTEERIHDSGDNAEEYMENLEGKDKDAEHEDGEEEDPKSNEDKTQEDDELDAEQAADGQGPLNSYGCDTEGLGHFNSSVDDKNKEDGEAKAEQVAYYGDSKEDDVKSNEDLHYMEIDEDEDAEDENSEEDDTENKTQEEGEPVVDRVAVGNFSIY